MERTILATALVLYFAWLHHNPTTQAHVVGTVRAYESVLRGTILGEGENFEYSMPVIGTRISQGSHGKWNGVDIAAPEGTPVHAVNPGKVILSQFHRPNPGSRSYGNMIVIDHGNGIYSVYAHLAKRLVSSGAIVEAGMPIGFVGSTGTSTGPHLHFEMRGAEPTLAYRMVKEGHT